MNEWHRGWSHSLWWRAATGPLAAGVVAALTASCVHVPPEMSLEGRGRADLRRMALHVSAAPISLRSNNLGFSQAQGAILGAGAFVGLFIPVAFPLFVGAAMIETSVEGGVRSSSDEKAATGVRTSLEPRYLEDVLARHFLEPFGSGSGIPVVSYADRPGTSTQAELTSERYDALIELEIIELSLTNAGGWFKLQAVADGKMIDGSTHGVIWKRQSAATSERAFTLESLLADQGRLLKEGIDRLLATIAKKLANDIIYSR